MKEGRSRAFVKIQAAESVEPKSVSEEPEDFAFASLWRQETCKRQDCLKKRDASMVDEKLQSIREKLVDVKTWMMVGVGRRRAMCRRLGRNDALQSTKSEVMG